MHLQRDPSAAGNGGPDTGHSSNEANPPGASDHIAEVVEQQAAPGCAEAKTRVIDDGENFGLLSPMTRAASLVIIAFQLGYTALDRIEYPLTFP